MSAELDGKVAVITGAARGIGRAIAFELSGMGARTVLLARNQVELRKVAEEIARRGGLAYVARCDLTERKDVEAVCAGVLEEHGQCDVLVNNAGVGHIGKPLYETSPEDWESTMKTNLRGPYLMLRAFAPTMIAAGAGHIVNMSSLAGKNPLPNGAAYSASKWGLNGLMLSAAEELRAHGVRVSIVSPGSVATDFGGSGGDQQKAARKLQSQDIAQVVRMIVLQDPQSFVSEVLVRPTLKGS